MNMPVSNRRSVKNILINRPLQREFTLFMIGIMMSAGVIVGVMIHFTLSGITEGSPSTISRIALERIVLDVNSQLIMGTVLVIFAAVIITGLFGIFFLHRVAGPVYRFKQVFKQISSGDLPRQIKLRDKDFFKETAAELNHVIEYLRQYDESAKKIEVLIEQHQGQSISPDLLNQIREIHQATTPLKKTV